MLSSIIAWFGAHSAVLGAAIVGLLDLVFALSPSLASNGILHFLMLQAQKLLGVAPKV